jgi:hypothetical protein
MDSNYPKAFDTLMGLEGYCSNIKEDRGGLTIWGITERYWPEMVKQMKDLPPEDSKKLAYRFYYDKYWVPNHCDKRETPDDLITFCIAVNNGMNQFDSTTWEGDLLGSIERYIQIVEKNPSQMKFFKGWMNRVVKLWRIYRSQAKEGGRG